MAGVRQEIFYLSTCAAFHYNALVYRIQDHLRGWREGVPSHHLVQGTWDEIPLHLALTCGADIGHKRLRWFHDEWSPGSGPVENMSEPLSRPQKQELTIWTAFDYPDAPTRGLLNAIMSVGSIVALPVTPYIADLFGRRVGIITGCLLMILGVVLQSIGINIQMFIASRFFIGFGVAVAHGAAPLLISELVHPQHRAVFTTIYNSTWYVGSVIAAWVTFGELCRIRLRLD